MDYGHELEFGAFLTPDAAHLDRLFENAQLADVLGLDIVCLQDHPYAAQQGDMWTLLSAIGARTTAVRLAPNVACLPLRPPVVLAKAAATLDLVTGGRVELGLGAGAFWDGIAAAGGPRRTPKQAVDALEEAMAIIRAFWAGDPVRFAGEHYSAAGLKPGPVPTHDIPIWLGAYKPRMLRVTGRLADVWIPSMGYADSTDLLAMNATIDEATIAAGRAPEAVRRAYNIFGTFGRDAGFLKGSAHEWAEQLAELTLTAGVSTYVLGSDDARALATFAHEVAPAVRELVTAERGRTTNSPSQPPAIETVAPEASARHAFSVSATTDNGTRLATERAWDEGDRPSYAMVGREYSTHEQATAQHLVDVHDHLRQELTQVRAVVEQVRAGAMDVGAARSAINTMTMRQNNWTLGAYCQAYCRVVTGHHTLEDRSIFRHLRRAEPGLTPVIDRLEAEHHVIHDLLDRLDEALVTVVTADGSTAALDDLAASLDLLTDALLSHLSYEERELLLPLAEHGMG